MKFFRWKKKSNTPQEHRRHYRRAPGRKHALGAKLQVEGQPARSVELLDLSAGGAAVAVAEELELEEGREVVLTLSSLHHGGQASVPARVARAGSMDDGRPRFGLEFTDQAALFQGLDLWYQRFFNRRRRVRVRPALDARLKFVLRAGGEERSLKVRDGSVQGAGVDLATEDLAWFGAHEEFEVEIDLPKADLHLVWKARRVHLTEVGGAWRAGFEFHVDEGNPERAALEKWVADREAEMARWDSAYE